MIVPEYIASAGTGDTHRVIDYAAYGSWDYAAETHAGSVALVFSLPYYSPVLVTPSAVTHITFTDLPPPPGGSNNRS